jgi:hypothetical protein
MAAHWSLLLAFACIVRCSEGIVLRGQAANSALSSEASGDLIACQQAETEDRNFLLAQLDDTESELVKLQQFLEVAGQKSRVLAGLQISATPAKSAAKTVEVKKDVAPAAKTAVKPLARKEAAPAVKKEAASAADPEKLMASLGSRIPQLKGTAALAPMLAMLKGLYEDSKSRIAQQNVREEKSKKWFAEKEAEHKKKMADIEGKFKNHTLSEEFRTNETRDETRYFTYWSRVRERQHRQFHTNLKIQHGMMSKVKKMVDMYEKTMSGKAGDKAAAQKQLSRMTGGGMPEIVFLQDMEHTVDHFCRDSLDQVRKERDQLQADAREMLA